jgi:hypothetical protein
MSIIWFNFSITSHPSSSFIVVCLQNFCRWSFRQTFQIIGTLPHSWHWSLPCWPSLPECVSSRRRGKEGVSRVEVRNNALVEYVHRETFFLTWTTSITSRCRASILTPSNKCVPLCAANITLRRSLATDLDAAAVGADDDVPKILPILLMNDITHHESAVVKK